MGEYNIISNKYNIGTHENLAMLYTKHDLISQELV